MRQTLHSKRYATGLTGTLLALVFAVIGLGIHTMEIWFPSMEISAGQEAPITLRLPSRYFRITMLRNEFHYLSTSSSACSHMVPRGTKLRPGKECTGLALAYQKHRRSSSPTGIAGIFTFYLLVGLVLTTFMRHKSMGRARQLRAQLTTFALLIFLLLGAKGLLLFTPLHAAAIPVVTVPLLVCYFCRRQVALLVAVVAAITVCSLVNYDIDAFLVYVISSIAAVGIIGKRRRFSVLLKGGATAAWVSVLASLITTAIFARTLAIHDDFMEHFDPIQSRWLAAMMGGLGSGLLSWALSPLIGLMMGEVSRNRLLDLQDLDQPLLKLLRDRAPGTWEHSRAMANLAEAAVHAIGANALLARVGAYYHDMGKSIGSDYFIENQGRDGNPHDELEPFDSTGKIFRHVTEGAKLLRQEGIPEDVVEFLYSHHGTSVLEFFWNKNMSEGNPSDFSEKDFSYPGHKPTTRETGIIMVVDAIEAAARTVDNPEKSTFQTLVQRLIFTKLCQGQLDETGLSLGDLAIVANTLVDTLVNMYHVRIKYPWQSSETTSTHSSAVTPEESAATVGLPGGSEARDLPVPLTPPNGSPIPASVKAEADPKTPVATPREPVASPQTPVIISSGVKTPSQGMPAVQIPAPTASSTEKDKPKTPVQTSPIESIQPPSEEKQQSLAANSNPKN